MNRSFIRILKVSIKNFKNVTCGSVSFDNSRKNYQASIVGLYGQNGSGKTALIDAIHLLKLCLCGQAIPHEYADYINVDADYATLIFDLRVENTDLDGVYDVTYEFSIFRDKEKPSNNTDLAEDDSLKTKVVILNEVLSYSYDSKEESYKYQTIVNTKTERVFIPNTKYKLLTNGNRSIETDLIVAKKMAMAASHSFIFSRDLLDAIKNNCNDESHKYLFDSLVFYGNFNLFVITTANLGLISLNELPIAFRYEEKNAGKAGRLMISLNEVATIPEEALAVTQKVIQHMNIVLAQLVPGLTIGITDLGTQLSPNNKAVHRIQLVSHKNNKEIPLQCESDGIKKIISVLHLLIVVFNRPSITVAIDELDAGIFEYLLGELLRIIAEKGKGQLIFTSHNLRPLETLDRGFIVFTTTNPCNRYIRLNSVKDNNNLRDFYFRDIVLGEQNEDVYEQTNNYEIAMAFREAGDFNGS